MCGDMLAMVDMKQPLGGEALLDTLRESAVEQLNVKGV